MIFGFPAVQQHPLANFEMAFLRPPPEGAIENAEEAEAIENAEEAEEMMRSIRKAGANDGLSFN